MEIRLKVEIGLEEDLKEFIGELIGGRFAVTPPLPEPLPLPEAQPEAQQQPETQTAPEPQTQPEPEPEPLPEAARQEPVPPTDDELRTLMDITISRFAGTGWAESADPAVAAVRRGCAAVFREIARHLGSDRPTGLRGEARTRFALELDNIFLEEGKPVWRAF